MIILGLGSNVGHRESNLRRAVRLLGGGPTPLLTNLKVSPLYESKALVPQGAPVNWHQDFLNCAVAGDLRSENLISFFQKIKNIEKLLGRTDAEKWAPRVVDIDILANDDLVMSNEVITVPHSSLHERPFALRPLLDLAPEWHHPRLNKAARDFAAPWQNGAPLETRRTAKAAARLMGIVNTTPDSFSDGSVFNEPTAVAARTRKMIDAGASVIDVGAESTRPGANLLSAHDEWSRIEPFLTQMKAEIPELGREIDWSIDTRHGEVAEKAFKLGVNWVNDVSGLEEDHLRNFVIESGCRVVVMHHLGIPPVKSNTLPIEADVTQTIIDWGFEKLNALGSLNPGQIILDPGIGFGKSSEQAATLLRSAERFRQWPCPVLIGHSRKSFIPAGVDRDAETALITANLASAGVEFIRVHNVPLNKQSIDMAAERIGVFL